MRSFCLNTLLAAACLFGGAALHAEVITTAQFHVPFAFVVGAVTLPAGTYDVIQPHDSSAVIIRAEGAPGVSAVIVSMMHEGSGHDASFVHVGGKYFLNTIALGDGRVVQVAAPHLK